MTTTTTYDLRRDHHTAPPAPPTCVCPDEPLTLFVWADPTGNFTGQVLLALAPTEETARELLVAEAADGDLWTVAVYRDGRAGVRPRPLGLHRNLWLQMNAAPQHITTPVGMRLRPLTPPPGMART